MHPALRGQVKHSADLECDDPLEYWYRASHQAHEDGLASGRNPLKVALRSALHTVTCIAGHNLWLTLAKLRRPGANVGSHCLL